MTKDQPLKRALASNANRMFDSGFRLSNVESTYEVLIVLEVR